MSVRISNAVMAARRALDVVDTVAAVAELVAPKPRAKPKAKKRKAAKKPRAA